MKDGSVILTGVNEEYTPVKNRSKYGQMTPFIRDEILEHYKNIGEEFLFLDIIYDQKNKIYHKGENISAVRVKSVDIVRTTLR